MTADEKRIVAWDKAMQRVFKGILPRPTRRRFLKKAAAK